MKLRWGDKSLYTLDQVFGITRGDTNHYVQRPQVDDNFLLNLTREKHVCIYGSSKQGKTALRKKHISTSEELVIVCDPEWNCNDIFAAILKAAGCIIEVNRSVTEKGKVGISGGLEATIKVPLVAEILSVSSFGVIPGQI